MENGYTPKSASGAFYHYTFEATREGELIEIIIVTEETEDAAYRAAYQRAYNGCRVELVEAEPAD